MLYECDKCYYHTSSLYNFERHKRRKYPCDKQIASKYDLLNSDVDQSPNVPNHQSNVPNHQSNVPNKLPNVPNHQSNVPNKLPNVENDTISTHMCSRCNKILSCAYTLKKHIQKCKGVHSLQCPICFKEFANRKNKHYHIHNQSCSPYVSNEVSNQSTLNDDHSTQHNTTATNNECFANYNNSQHCTTNFHKVNQNIHFTVFGKENLDYLLNDSNILQRLKAYGKKGVYGLVDIVEEVHCNEEQPQNNTIIKPVDYGDGVFIKGEDYKWEYREFEDIRSILIDSINKYVKMYNEVRNKKDVKLNDPREKAFIKKLSHILLSLQGDIPEDLYTELEINDKDIDDSDDRVKTFHRKFDKASMVKLNEYATKHVKKKNGKYVMDK